MPTWKRQDSTQLKYKSQEAKSWLTSKDLGKNSSAYFVFYYFNCKRQEIYILIRNQEQ